jgi:chromosome segregation ATPase
MSQLLAPPWGAVYSGLDHRQQFLAKISIVTESLAPFVAGILIGVIAGILFFQQRKRRQSVDPLGRQLDQLLRQLSEADQERSQNRSDIDELTKLLKGYQEDRQELERAFEEIQRNLLAVSEVPVAMKDGVGDLLRRHQETVLAEMRTSLQELQSESSSAQDKQELKVLLEREAALRAEAYRVVDVVTEIIGKMEETGDDLVTELKHYQTGRRGYDGSRSLKGLIRAVIRFSNFWNRTRAEVDRLVSQNKGVERRLEELHGADY